LREVSWEAPPYCGKPTLKRLDPLRRKSVKPFGSGVPEFYRSIQTPREQRLIGQHEQTGHASLSAKFLYSTAFAPVLEPAAAGACKAILGQK
jgi:hypothetical protein